MNEGEDRNKLAIIFNHFNVLMKYTKNDKATFFLSDDLIEFYEEYDEYSNRIFAGEKHDLDALKKFYDKFKIYSPSAGKCKLILQSVDNLIKSLQSQIEENENSGKFYNKIILNLVESDTKNQIDSIKKKIADYQKKISELKIQKKVIEQECITKIQNASDYVDKISNICKEMAPENLKKADDHNIRMITDLIYIIEEMQ